MDYEKKYKEALERAMKFLNKELFAKNSECAIKHIFPELKEQEDEEVRKDLIGFFKDEAFLYHKKEQILAWLEKQKTKKDEWLFEKGKWYVKLQHHYEGDLRHFEKGHAYQALSEVEITDGYHNVSLGSWEIPEYFRPATKDEIPKETEQTSGLDEDEEIRNYFINAVKEQSNIHQEYKEKCLNWLEKQGEQNPTDNVEPKFKVGDYVVGKYISGYISEVREDCYLLDYQGFSIDKQDNYHLWTIQDAKDGDVIYSPCCKLLWIYKDEKTCHVGSNLNYNSGSIVINKPVCIPTDVQPATKEQRDLLFQKMKEAGYEWDAEKKELKIVDWSKHIKCNPNPPSIIKESAWSEEDEKMCQETIDWFEKKCFPYALESENPARESIKWLKSLKQRIKGE